MGRSKRRATPTSHNNFFSLPRHSKEPHSTIPHLRPPPPPPNHPRRPSQDTELGIFGAPQRSLDDVGVQQTEAGRHRRRQKKGAHPSALPATPTTSSSEASSWSSHLRSLSGSAAGSVAAGVGAKPSSLNKQRRPATPWPLRGTCSTCPCTRRKAVDVEERRPVRRSSNHIDFRGIGSVSLNQGREAKAAAGEEEASTKVYYASAPIGGHGAPTDQGTGLAVEEMVTKLTLAAESWVHGRDRLLCSSDHLLRREGFQFGVPYSDGVVKAITFPVGIPPDVDQSRFSLEVFQPAAEAASPSPRGSAEFRRLGTRPSTFPADAAGPPRRSSANPVSPVARVVAASLEDELASDSSSDLFEIETFSTQATPSRPGHRRGRSPAKTPAGASASRASPSAPAPGA